MVTSHVVFNYSPRATKIQVRCNCCDVRCCFFSVVVQISALTVVENIKVFYRKYNSKSLPALFNGPVLFKGLWTLKSPSRVVLFLLTKGDRSLKLKCPSGCMYLCTSRIMLPVLSCISMHWKLSKLKTTLVYFIEFLMHNSIPPLCLLVLSFRSIHNYT